MATTTSQPQRAPWPHGKLLPIIFGPCSHPAGDTSGYKIFDIRKADFDYYVRRAELAMQEASWASGANMLLKVEDDQDTPQVIIAERAVTTADDAGTTMPLTVGDAGPVRTGAEVALKVDSGDGSGAFEQMTVTLWVEPAFA